MRAWLMAVALSSMLAVMGASAQSPSWKGYISHPLGFSFEAPGEVVVETGTYRAPVAGERDTIVFRTVNAGVEYTVTVADTVSIEDNAATLLNEAMFMFQAGNRLVMDTFARVDRVYGRKLTVDLPNDGGRKLGAFYFIRGRIIVLEAMITPESGDYGTPEAPRFIDSVAFFTTRARPDSIELTLPQ